MGNALPRIEPMVVTSNDITERFDELIQGARSRESIEQWAIELMKAEDSRQLHYDPPADEKRIWQAVLYLTGVGLCDGQSHLHSIENFEVYRRQNGF